MKLLAFAALFAASSPSFDTLQLVEGRADSAEVLAVLFHDSPEMSAYQRGRADGLREAVQIIRWSRSTETNSHEDHSRNPQ